MSATIHTRFRAGTRGSFIRAWSKDGKGAMALRVPYAHELHHSKRHPAAAKALAEKLGWSGIWIVGTNWDNSVTAVHAPGCCAREKARSGSKAKIGFMFRRWHDERAQSRH